MKKNSILTLTSIALIAGALFTSCMSSSNKEDNTGYQKLSDKKESIADKSLKTTENDSLSDYQLYKSKAEERISDFEKDIANLKTKIANEKKEDKAVYEKKLAVLEKKNSDMKKKLVEYTDEGNEKWDTFATEFGRDMDDLGNSLKNFTINNTKQD